VALLLIDENDFIALSPSEIRIKTDGSTSYELYPRDLDSNQTDEFTKFELQKNKPLSNPLKVNESLYMENDNSSFQTDKINKTLEFRIQKEKENQIKEAFDKSKEYIIIRFVGSGEIISIESDTDLKDTKIIDKYYYDDNDTNHDGDIS